MYAPYNNVFFTCYMCFVQVHELDSATWQSVKVVPIDIAGKVSNAVSTTSSVSHTLLDKSTVWRPHVDMPGHYYAAYQTQSTWHKKLIQLKLIYFN